MPSVLSVVTLNIASASPGALAITVPSGAQGVVVLLRGQFDAFTVSSSFSSSFTITPSGGGAPVVVATAQVSATGSQTITPSYGSYLAEGAAFFVAFVDGIDNTSTATWVRAVAASSSSSQTIASTTTDLVLAMDNWYTGGSGTPGPPPNESGWTSLGTHEYNNIAGRLRSANSPGASTTTATAQTGSGGAFSAMAEISIIAASSSPTNYSLTCDAGAYTLTGVAATTSRGVRLVSDVGAYAITGQAATTSRGYRVTADVGAYALTGQSATTARGIRLIADTGAYTLTGQDATLIYGAGPANYSLMCDVGAYSLTGIDATLTYSAGAANYTLTCDAGAYSLTGIDATLTYTPGTANYSLVCDTGVYSLSGQAAVTSLGRRLIADVGAYSLTGQSATTSVGRRLVADVGGYTLTGYDATLTSTSPTEYVLGCDVGSYSLAGVDARLVTSVQDQTLSAGFLWMLRRQREMEEALRNVPEPVAEVIKAEAPRVIEKPKAQARNELRRSLEQENLPYRAAYTQALERLVQQLRQEREDDEEEEAIAEALLYVL